MDRRFVRGVSVVALGLASGACTAERSEPTLSSNSLTQTESEAGWRLLFDGVTTTGWKAYGDGEFPSGGWQVEDGLLRAGATGDSTAPRGDIVTVETFGDFELSFEFKITPVANSGVFYRVVETPGLGMWSVAPEFQVLDGPAYVGRDDFDTTTHLTGDNYDLHVSSVRNTMPLGAWNHARIVMDGAHVEHWLNGDLTVEYELWTPEWEELVARSKFQPFEAYGRAEQGSIGLQDHDPGNVWYRNIKIRSIQ